MNKVTSERYDKFTNIKYGRHITSHMYVIPATWQRPLGGQQAFRLFSLHTRPRPLRRTKTIYIQKEVSTIQYIVWSASVFLSFPTAGTGRWLIVIVLCMYVCECVLQCVRTGGRGLDFGERFAPRAEAYTSSPLQQQQQDVCAITKKQAQAAAESQRSVGTRPCPRKVL